MLERLLIFTKGGLILWAWTAIEGALRSSPVDALIRSCFLERRSADSSFDYVVPGTATSYTLNWIFDNELGLVFVAVYYRAFRLVYIGDLLAAVRCEFSQLYDPRRTAYDDFGETFRQLWQEAEAKTEATRKPKQVARVQRQGRRAGPQGDRRQGSGGDSGEDDTDGESGEVQLLANGSPDGHGDGAEEPRALTVVNDEDDSNPDHGVYDVDKLLRTGHGVGESGIDQRGDGNGEVAAADQGESMMDKEEIVSTKKDWFSSMCQRIAGNTILEKSDLEPALDALKDMLIVKNVAEEIATELCKSVAASLEGKKLGSFTVVSSIVQTAMEEALLSVLTPGRSVDILREVHAAKDQRKPYVIVFVGVNGVGKTTNIAKVAYWLLEHNLRVMLAACDTFRAGAVEQLRTHACRLEIPVFEKGYGKGPARVAKEAIREASRNNSDVVLVDTAGRMMDNEPLMRELSKLIDLNKPDLVLFVEEALAGNEATDQLSKFNQKLGELSAVPNARIIDGILLTKFDTIGDKVGAAVSMVYTSGLPVMFLGCGQLYTDLKKLDVKSIVKTLLK